MPKFRKGDRVRIRIDVASPLRGRIATIGEEPSGDSFWYIVKLESEMLSKSYFFAQQDIESLYSRDFS
jgi:hypothetical protein